MTSNYYKKPFLNSKGLEKQYLNSIVGNHDLWCSCDDPIKHTVDTIFTHAKPENFNQETKNKILKCLGEDPTTTDPGPAADDGFGPGDLDLLFAAAADAGEKE